MCRCKQPAPGTVNNVSDEASGGTELLLHGVYLVGTEKPYEVEVQIAGQLVKMQVDTGAAVSLVPECVHLAAKAAAAACEVRDEAQDSRRSDATSEKRSGGFGRL
ncbi:hypothetical protein MRX96_036149 [Rhipicephalus microplus]